jgi:hypothetical protein
MKYILLLLILTSCASMPSSKRTMQNCVHKADNYFICEEIPEHKTKEEKIESPQLYKPARP